MSSNPQQVQAIFLATVERPPAEWAAHLDGECGDDAELRQRVEALLQAHDEAGSFLNSPPPGMAATLDQPVAGRPGAQIGPYKLLQQIGEGGMGVVYMAEQKEPVKRRVALKIIKPGMDTRQVIARIEAERQALAMMDHPHIAKVLDAGATESGRPYFVMELVNGLPVTKYCDEQRLTPTQRLELFVPICQAVQHAHQKGIIHRDLKPSNILVALYDGKPVPKVIDFGVAKATNQTLTEKTMFTQLGQVVGTLEYMSPEQAERNQLDIDTRSDIYSLGVVLYELLTGETPIDRERLRSAAFDEILRIIREEEPSRPSTKVSSSQSLPSIAANRTVEPAKLGLVIRGELDWIVMKALEKDRARRYATANDFAEDIRHYLDDEPVAACPPSMAYRFRKLARRHRAALVSVSLVATALLLGAAVSAWMAFAARQARLEAEQQAAIATEQRKIARRAVDDMYVQVAEKWLALRPRLTAVEQEFLEKALKYYEQLADQNADDADIQCEMGEAWRRVADIRDKLGRGDEAEEAFRKSRNTLAQLAARYPSRRDYQRELARTLNNMGAFHAFRGERSPAEECFLASMELRQRLSQDDSASDDDRHELAASISNLGALHSNDPACAKEALAELQSAADIWQELIAGSGDAPPLKYRRGLAMTQHGLAHVAQQSGQFDEAERLFRRAVAIGRQLVDERRVAPQHRRELAMSLSDLGEVLAETNRCKEATDALLAAVEVLESLSRDFPGLADVKIILAETYSNLGLACGSAGQMEDAEAYLRRSVTLREQSVTQNRESASALSRLGGSKSNLARLLRTQGHLPDAEALLLEAINHQRKALRLSPKNAIARQFLSIHMWGLCDTYLQMGDHTKAADVADDLAQSFPDNAGLLDRAARFLARSARLAADDASLDDDARQTAVDRYLRRSRECEFKAAQLDFQDTSLLLRLARFLVLCPDAQFRDPARAERLVSAIPEERNQVLVMNTLGIVRYRQQRWQEAKETLTAALDLPDGDIAANWFFLAMAHHQLSGQAEADRCLRQARERIQQEDSSEAALIRAEAEATLSGAGPAPPPKNGPGASDPT